MTTLANEGNLSQLDIARWAGRKDARHNRYYDHETAASLVSKARAVGEDMFDRAITVTPRGPVTAEQLLEGTLPAVHLTKYGACLHDFAMSPCPFYRDCLNCVEHACVKGEERAETVLRSWRKRLQPPRTPRPPANATRKSGCPGRLSSLRACASWSP